MTDGTTEFARNKLAGTEGALTKARTELAAARAAFDVDMTTALERKVVTLESFVGELRIKAAEERDAACRTAAEKRLLGIRRALGSKVHVYNERVAKLVKEAAGVGETASAVESDFRDIRGLLAEAHGIADRFGLDASGLPSVVAPALRKDITACFRLLREIEFSELIWVRPLTESCEFGLRTRRTYAELQSNSEGRKLIEEAGPKPWPELSKTQQEIIDSREAQEKESQRSLVPVAAELESLRVEQSLGDVYRTGRGA